jgi:hypothetical protein
MVFDREKWLKLCMEGKTCIGLSSVCADSKHVVLLDYDGLPLIDVVEDFKELQRKFKLPYACLVKTKNGYHVYCLAKFTYDKLFEIIEASECDPWFKDRECRENMKQVILRISARGRTPPPRFKAVIPSRWNGYHETSFAHWIFLKWFFKAPLPYPENNDGSRRLLIFLYKTLRD